MTKVIALSGVHGVGKSTVARKLAQRLESAGQSVYVFPEMSYVPNIEVGTIEFQIWFKKQIIARDFMVEALIDENIFDYIIMDRLIVDIDIYTSRLLYHSTPKDIPFPDVEYEDSMMLFVLDADVDIILNRIKFRGRDNKWGELDRGYVMKIKEAFEIFADIYMYRLWKVDNVNLEDTVQKIMEVIY